MMMLRHIGTWFDPRDKSKGISWPHYSFALAVCLVVGLGTGIVGTRTYDQHHGYGGLKPGPLPPLTRALAGGVIPASVSLDRYVVRVHRQGDESCVGQTTAEITEIEQAEHGTRRAFSSGFIWNQITGGYNAPSSWSSAFPLLQSEGDAPLSVFPADGQNTDYAIQPNAAQIAAAYPYRIRAWRSVSPTDHYTQMVELSHGKPLAVGLTVQDSFYNHWGDGTAATSQWGAVRFDHSLLAIGYNSFGLELLQSWGTDWGNNGRLWVSWAFVDTYIWGMIVADPLAPIVQKPRHRGFQYRIWYSYKRLHHKSLRGYSPWAGKHHLKFEAASWRRYGPKRAGGIISKRWYPTRRPVDGYITVRFRQSRLYYWPHHAKWRAKWIAVRRLAGGIDQYALECGTTGKGCARYELIRINLERAQYGYPPLALDWNLTHTSTSCIGATGHARHMAALQAISHDQFPQDICESYRVAEENVGVATGGKLDAISQIHNAMASEPYSPGCENSHHCAWMSPEVTRIGIGFARGSYAGWSGWYESQEFVG